MTSTGKSPRSKKGRDFFLFAHEYGIGGKVDLKYKHDPIRVSYSAPDANIKEVKRANICNGFRIWRDPSPYRLARSAKGGYGMMIDFWLTEGRMELFARQRGMTLQTYIDATADNMLRYMRRYGNMVWWNVWPEIDNPRNPYNWGFWPESFSGREEFYEFVKEHFTTDKYCRNRDKRVITVWDPYIGFKKPAFQYLQERGLDLRKVNLSVLTCRVVACHHYLEWGAGLVQQEANIGFANIQVSVAFLRGAAKQYRGAWGFDVAPWKAPLPVHYDRSGKKGGGLSESLLLREWLVMFVSGTNYLCQQFSDVTHWIEDKPGRKRLSPLGRIARDFYDFAFKRHSNRGKTYTPVALMLEKYHGWDCPQGSQGENKQACMGSGKYERKDYMIEKFFSYVFPGYEKRPSLHVPAKNGIEARILFNKMMKEGLDTRPHEKGELVASPWGDSFDVILENASLELLKQYRAIVLLGGITISPELRAKLKAYCKAGGKVVVNSGQVNNDDQEWLGVKFKGNRGYASSSACSQCRSKFRENEYFYPRVRPISAEVLARTRTGHDPIITRNTFGKGEIFFTAPDLWMNKPESKEPQLLEIIKDALGHIFAPLMTIEIDGEPLEHIVNRTASGRMVTLVNNSGETWSGKVTVKDAAREEEIRDLWNDKFLFDYTLSEKGATINMEIPPWGFSVIGIGKFSAS